MNPPISQRTPFFTLLFSRRMNLRAKLILGFSLIATLASLVTAFAVYTTTQRQIFENFRRRVLTAVAITALQQNGNEFERVTSESEPLYEKIRLQNLKILRSDPDLVFVYTMRKDAQGIYFVVDGNELDAEGFSAYGDRYLEPSPFLVKNFDTMTSPIVEPEIYTDEYGSFISAYAPILAPDGRQVGVVALDIAADTITQEQRQLLVQSIVIFLGVLAMGIILGNLVGNALTKPVTKLAQGALAFASGEFSQRVEINTHDEIGDLAKTFNGMAGEIQGMIGNLENRVIERTSAANKRAAQFKTVADVGKIITSFRNLSELLQQTTHLIRENFGYYHAGIFLLDERKEYAVLTAANSEGGQRMLEKKHQLKVGETSIVGYTIENTKARIALDVGKDAVYFDNPELPETRSEMALPLVVGGQVLGALDVQSRESQAFSEDDISTLQILADQIAVAIQNANLFNENEKALEAARVVYGEVSRDAWSKILRNQARIGFIATPPATVQTYGETLETTLAQAFETGDLILGSDGLTISVPIKIRGQAIGAIRLKKSEISEAWTQDETNLAIALADQLSGALESARLYRESQQRAARESLVSDISARISASSYIDTIVRETVQELGQAIGNASVTFQLLDQPDGQKQVEGGALSALKDTENRNGNSNHITKAGE